MFNPVRRRRRTLAMLYLSVATGMLFWGHLIFQQALTGPSARIYWFLCAQMAGMAVLGSLVEAGAGVHSILLQLARSQKQLRDCERQIAPVPIDSKID